jgi:SET domain-containing protein
MPPGVIGAELVIDAHVARNAIGYINDYRDFSGRRLRQPNAQFVAVFVRGWPHIVCVTLMDIAAGEEILVDYGERYWRDSDSGSGTLTT